MTDRTSRRSLCLRPHVSLNPGQTTPFNTSISVDVTQFWYKMTCTIQVLFDNLNTNKSNDSYTETLSK